MALTPSAPRTARLATPDALLEYVVAGQDAPVTVFAHGAGASIDETRPLGTGVGGTKAYLHFRGHGGSRAAEDAGWGYPSLATDLLAVADEVSATRALGVSMGAGALMHLLLSAPGRFERVVLFLPAAIDERRAGTAVRRLREMADHIDAADVAWIERRLREDLPDGARSWRGVDAYVRGRAAAVAGTDVSHALRGLCEAPPVPDRERLRAVTCPVLLVGQEGDTVHPAAVARELATVFPDVRLEVFDAGGALWGGRKRLRSLLAGFLA